MKTEIKEFIKEQHAEACGEWKVKIEEKFPELFKSQLEIGKWYRRGHELLVWNNGKRTYGFSSSGDWNSSMLCSVMTGATPATNKEVETALIAEAKRRGFKEGVKFNAAPRILDDGSYSTYFRGTVKNVINMVMYDHETALLNDGLECIFTNGKWATIIEEETKIDFRDELHKIQNRFENRLNEIFKAQNEEIEEIINKLK